MFDELKQVLSAVHDLPPMPPVASRVMALIRDGKASATDMARLIANDPAMAAQIMKFANSAFYSLSRQVKTLEHAIVVLGDEALKSLVLAACLKGLNKSFGPVEKMLWEDAVGCSFAARLVAKRLVSADAEEAFLGGLFRNLGKLVLNNLDASGYRRLIEEAARLGRSPDELEPTYFPSSHMLIGAAVLLKWKFPENLIHAVRYYPTLERASGLPVEAEGLMATVNIADDFCRRLGIGRPGPEPRGDLGQVPGALLLGVEAARLVPILNEFEETFRRESAAVLF